MNKNNKITATTIAGLAILVMFGAQAQAQAQIQAPTTVPKLTVQAMQQLQQQTALLHSTLALIQQKLGTDRSPTHLLQIFSQLSAAGIIKCPTGFTSPTQCKLTPPTLASTR